MEGSHNWGAIQCPNTGSDCSPEKQRGFSCALYSDTLDGTERTRYKQCFRVFESDLDGAGAVLKELYKRRSVPPALRTGDCLLISKMMRDSNYYGKLVPVRHYAYMIYSNAREAAARLREPLVLVLGACDVCGAPAGADCLRGCPGVQPVVVQAGASGASSSGGLGDLVVPAAAVGLIWWLNAA